MRTQNKVVKKAHVVRIFLLTRAVKFFYMRAALPA